MKTNADVNEIYILRWLVSMWRRLTTLPISAPDQQSARFLAQLILVLILLAIFVLVTAIPVGLVTPDFTRVFDLGLYVGVALLLILLYWLNRRGYFRLAAYSVIGLIAAAVLLAGLPYQSPDRILWLDYLVIPLILSIVLLPTRSALAASAGILGSTFILAALIPGFDMLTLIFGPLTFNLAVVALLIAVWRFIQGLESERRAQLVASEERLRQSEQNYRQVVELSPAPIIIYDGVAIQYANPAAVELFGAASTAEIVGKTAHDFLHPDYRTIAGQQIRAALEQRQDFRNAERKLLRLDGDVVDVEAAGNPVLFNNRPAVQVVYKNITSHKQRTAAERTRRLNAERLRDSAAALSSTLNLDEVLERILVYAAQIVPHDAARIMLIQSGMAHVVRARGMNAQPALDTAPLSVQDTPYLQQMMAARQPLLLPAVAAAPNHEGLPSWVKSHLGAPIIVDNQVIGFIALDSSQPHNFRPEHMRQLQAFADQASSAIQNALLYDTVQQYNNLLEEFVEERTAELLRTKDNVEAILNSTRDALVVAYADGRIEQANPAFQQLLGYGAGEDLPLRRLVELVEPGDVDVLTAALKGVASSGQPARLEVQMRRRDGTCVPVDALLSPVAATVRQPGTIVCSLRDMSDQKRVQTELLRALEHERELSELKTRFTTTVSHEFRTPLAVILSSSDILKHYYERLSETRKQEHLAAIQTHVHRLSDMLDDMLIIARSQAVGLKFTPEPLDVEPFFRQVVQEFWEMYETSHELDFQLAGAAGSLMGDSRLLHRMLGNLLSNAVKYSPPDSTVHVLLTGEPEQVRLSVQDEGIGILPEDRPHVFEMFFRAANVGSVSGTGLGLSLVKEVVDLHSGQLDIQPAPQGTIFTVVLPRRLPAEKT